jgi:RES domain-containing protein/transcription elongation factor Elf1
MGRAKEMMLAVQERGWFELDDKFVCSDCVDEPFLQSVIEKNTCSPTCSYCGTSKDGLIAAPANTLQQAIYSALWKYYSEPSSAGVPYDEGYFLEESMTFGEVIDDLGLDCNLDLRDDLIRADIDCGYVRAYEGSWAASSKYEVLLGSWSAFSHTVMHRTRFNFSTFDDEDIFGEDDMFLGQEIPPRYMLDALGDQFRAMVSVIEKGTQLYRVRSRAVGDTWQPDADQMGAPAPEIATAGRMNPAGIPYLYTSLDYVTAVHEARASKRTTRTVFVGQFELSRPLLCLDLTMQLDLPSLFDVERSAERESGLFLKQFVKEISQAIRPDDKVHLSYVPTQVVCEYLAQVFKTPEGKRLDGLIFPSSLRANGSNLVVFPSRGSADFRGVMFKQAFKYQRPRKGDPEGLFELATGRLLPL